MSSQFQQVLIAADQQIGPAALGQIEEGLIIRIPAERGTSLDLLNYLAVGEVFGQQLMAVVCGQSKLRVFKNPYEFGCGCVRDERYALAFLPM